jgi:hypothetical protein
MLAHPGSLLSTMGGHSFSSEKGDLLLVVSI